MRAHLRLVSQAELSSSMQKYLASAWSSSSSLLVSGSGIWPSLRKFRIEPKCLPFLSIKEKIVFTLIGAMP